MLTLLIKLILNLFLLFGGYFLIQFIKSNRNQWELEPELNLYEYHSNTSKHGTIYNISQVIEKNEALNHTLDELRVRFILLLFILDRKHYFSKFLN